jgi:hypothetical protein
VTVAIDPTEPILPSRGAVKIPPPYPSEAPIKGVFLTFKTIIEISQKDFGTAQVAVLKLFQRQRRYRFTSV